MSDTEDMRSMFATAALMSCYAVCKMADESDEAIAVICWDMADAMMKEGNSRYTGEPKSES